MLTKRQHKVRKRVNTKNDSKYQRDKTIKKRQLTFLLTF